MLVSIKTLTNQTRVTQWLRLRFQQCCKIQCLKIENNLSPRFENLFSWKKFLRNLDTNPYTKLATLWTGCWFYRKNYSAASSSKCFFSLSSVIYFLMWTFSIIGFNLRHFRQVLFSYFHFETLFSKKKVQSQIFKSSWKRRRLFEAVFLNCFQVNS